jgi:cation diffusion facilitator family transporter
MDSELRYRLGNKVSRVSIIVNVLLSICKVAAGLIGKSGAMIADGIHSLSDVLSTFIVIIGLKMSKKPEDEDHPYGHEKMEPVMTKLLAVVLFITAVGIGYKGIIKIKIGDAEIPGKIALYAAVISIIVKEWMYRYTVNVAKKIDSSALRADAWHHRTDAFSSIGTFIGVIGARLGYPIFDPIASIVISLFIGKAAVDIYLQAIHQLVDHSADKDTIESMNREIMSIDGVIKIDSLKTRIHANRMYVDVEIGVSGSLTVGQGHEIAEKVHHTIENGETRVKHCMVHVNPYNN